MLIGAVPVNVSAPATNSWPITPPLLVLKPLLAVALAPPEPAVCNCTAYVPPIVVELITFTIPEPPIVPVLGTLSFPVVNTPFCTNSCPALADVVPYTVLALLSTNVPGPDNSDRLLPANALLMMPWPVVMPPVNVNLSATFVVVTSRLLDTSTG